MTAVAAPHPANNARLLPSVGVLTGRALRIYRRTPQLLILRIVQSVAFLLIFRYVFGGAIGTGTMRYVDFMAPGLLTVGIMFATIGTALGVAEDHVGGLFDRLRSLPMPRSAVLTGRVLADLAMTVAVLIPTIAIAFAVGMRVHTDWASALGALGLLVLFGFAFVWIFVAVGLLAGSVQAAQGISFIVMPISFASSAFVPTSSMPGWLQAFTEHQPVTVVVNAVRTLTQGAPAEALLGHSTGYYVTRALIWMVALIVVFAGLAIARYRSR
ncbi:ABC transporter permease [Micromonospora sp. NPDC005299]|uniref:ABC transporter permease n=1 Tax=Micromonospora sp. NPDC005299 TaxID=3364231 RepID=UPI0036B0EB47